MRTGDAERERTRSMTTDPTLLARLQELWTQPANVPNVATDARAEPGKQLDAPAETEPPKASAGTSLPARCSTADAIAALRLRPPGTVAPAGSARCLSHLDRRDWLTVRAANRPGWLRTTCRRCGSFIGYRPDDK